MDTNVRTPPLLEVQGLHKTFGKLQAITDVNFSIGQAEVMGLLGDNGAGKSTLIKVLAGLVPPDTGEIKWKGERQTIKSPSHALELGISVAYQDLAIVEQMSVWRNLYLGREAQISRTVGPLRGPFRLLGSARARAAGGEALSALGIHLKDIDIHVEKLSGGERQSIAIARAVLFESSLLILDEPTSALSLTETEKVLGYVRSAKDAGVSVVIITHNLSHAVAVSDSFLVLHQGSVALRCRSDEVGHDELIIAINTGRAPMGA